MEYRLPSKQEEQRKKKILSLLESDRFQLLEYQPFIGSFLLRQNLIPVVDCRCPTASTDGQNIFVNPDFYLALKPGERVFVLAHEVWHTVYLHFLRRKNRDRKLFNIATDMEINHMLSQEPSNGKFSLKAPAGALMPPPEWAGLNAEEIYEQLKRKNQWKQSFDVHLEPDAPIPGIPEDESDSQKDGSDSQKDGSGNQKDESGNQGRSGKTSTEENGSAAESYVIDPDFQVDFGNHPEEKIREKVIESAVYYEKQSKKQKGNLPGNIARLVEQFQSGKLHWKELLAQFVTSCFGGSRRWLPPNRRYISSGLYLQSRRDSSLQAVLAIDTSGSTAADLPRFAAELVNLLNTFGRYELTVICCDYVIQSVETYTQDTPFDAGKVRFKGGGGTRFTPVFDYLKQNPSEAQILIYLTDGYGDLPEKPPYPVMWVITPDGHNEIPWGYEIKLDRES